MVLQDTTLVFCRNNLLMLILDCLFYAFGSSCKKITLTN